MTKTIKFTVLPARHNRYVWLEDIQSAFLNNLDPEDLHREIKVSLEITLEPIGATPPLEPISEAFRID